MSLLERERVATVMVTVMAREKEKEKESRSHSILQSNLSCSAVWCRRRGGSSLFSCAS